jgi:[acyl-carrier-protein] S-malonyltransferase
MSKVAFVFPGQGSQAVGMCKDLYEAYPVARHIFEEADKALGFSMTDLIFKGPEEALRLTENTQPAILTASVACFEVLKEKGIACQMAGGHSLGEYSALVAAGALSFADAVRTVKSRGKFMQEAVPVGQGSMAAILGMEPEKVDSICKEVEKSCGEAVQAVNFNCPGQIVIAGATGAVNKAIEALKAAGAKRAIPLKVSAPFHSTLMTPAAKRLAEVLDKVAFHDAAFPVVANVTAKPETKAEEIKSLLVRQADHPVRWENSVHTMIDAGVDTFVEVGPGKVLTGFTKKIDKTKTVLNVENIESLENTLAYFKGAK